MIKNNENELQFWEYGRDGKPKILQSKLIGFLESEGFLNVKVSETNRILAFKSNNLIKETSIAEVVTVIKKYLTSKGLLDVYEQFAKGMSGYVYGPKLNLLKTEPLLNDRDGKTNSKFYFKNCFVTVTKSTIESLKYDKLNYVIWEDRIINRNIVMLDNKRPGQFEVFCKNICKNDDARFMAIKTMLGYLLHRNKEIGEDKAIILYDENMCLGNKAHGGTGKTLLSQALGLCRELETFDGKEVKTGSWFKNQRINITTDVLVYDDLNKQISLENFFAMITSGIEVEKKGKQAFYIKREDSPKILITSNYLVKGPGGSSDERRRHEFELANYYSDTFRPEDEFKNRFFDSYWGDEQWNRFYLFMMSCVQDYFRHGLLQVESLNIQTAKQESKSCKEFMEFAKDFIEPEKWLDKRDYHKTFEELYLDVEKVSPHRFSKWLSSYASDIGGIYKSDSSGGDYKFIINVKN